MQTLDTASDLVRASGGDPLVRHLLPHLVPGAPMFADDGAVLFIYDYWDGEGGQLVGEPAACARLIRAASRQLPTEYVAVPVDAVGELTDVFTPAMPWRFRWTDERPSLREFSTADWLEPGQYAEVEALLDSSFPDASARPGNRHAQRWAGLRDADGTLIATAADCSEGAVGFMASVAADVRRRRTGAGLAMTTWMTHALLDEYGIAALWQYSDNAPATALYDKLGFRDDHRYHSGTLLR